MRAATLAAPSDARLCVAERLATDDPSPSTTLSRTSPTSVLLPIDLTSELLLCRIARGISMQVDFRSILAFPVLPPNRKGKA